MEALGDSAARGDRVLHPINVTALSTARREIGIGLDDNRNRSDGDCNEQRLEVDAARLPAHLSQLRRIGDWGST